MNTYTHVFGVVLSIGAAVLVAPHTPYPCVAFLSLVCLGVALYRKLIDWVF